MINKILVPLDCSVLGEAALPLARHLARQNDAELVLFHSDYPKSLSTISDIETAERENAAEYLNMMLTKEALATDMRVSSATSDGITADRAIVDYADQNEVDMIVMSTHGTSGMGRALIGSIADKVVKAASIPVMVVRPKKDDVPHMQTVHANPPELREQGDS